MQASTRKPLYGSLNTESHLPNTASLFPVEGKNINKEKEKKKSRFHCNPSKWLVSYE